ncbi:MAG: hypothetical protein FJZ60_00215 [Chlamydiae bacterium]|nr:hypothetical protein [Chlamydiota bacterium]
MKKIISVLLLASLFISNLSFAQDIDISPDPDPADFISEIPPVKLAPGEKDPGKALSPMRRGQRAPFTGVLLSPSAVADVIVELESTEDRIHIEVLRALKIEQAEYEKKTGILETRLQAEKNILQASIDKKNKDISDLNAELEKAKKAQTNPFLWASAGFAGGLLVTVLTVFAVTQATK